VRAALLTNRRHLANPESSRGAPEFDKFVAEQGPAVIKEYGLEEGDLDDGGLAIAAWIASLVKDAEREKQPHVDATIRYLDPSTSA
jgi:hypothetical protein